MVIKTIYLVCRKSSPKDTMFCGGPGYGKYQRRPGWYHSDCRMCYRKGPGSTRVKLTSTQVDHACLRKVLASQCSRMCQIAGRSFFRIACLMFKLLLDSGNSYHFLLKECGKHLVLTPFYSYSSTFKTLVKGIFKIKRKSSGFQLSFSNGSTVIF